MQKLFMGWQTREERITFNGIGLHLASRPARGGLGITKLRPWRVTLLAKHVANAITGDSRFGGILCITNINSMEI